MFQTAIPAKLVMAFTGLLLFGFVVAHLAATCRCLRDLSRSIVTRFIFAILARFSGSCD